MEHYRFDFQACRCNGYRKHPARPGRFPVLWIHPGFRIHDCGHVEARVLHYRALKHGIASRRDWDVGDFDQGFRYNNYLGRFHWGHIDLMDVLAAYQGRGRASLENVAALLGLPGKLGMSGDKVWDAYRAGRLPDIRAYCETDVLNTYLVYLRFELIRGRVTREAYEEEVARVWEWLEDRTEPHWQQFATPWDVT